MAVRASRWNPRLAVVLVGMCGMATACGSGAPAGGTAAATSREVPSPQSGPTVDGLDQAKLGALQNYAFTSVNSDGSVSMTWTGKVHSPTDWEVKTDSPAVTTYDVDGHGSAIAIGQVERVTFKTPEGVGHLLGEVSFAEQLFGYTHVAGIKITQGAPCTVAGASGVTFHVQVPNASIVNETAQACVDRSSGALLSYQGGVTGGSAADSMGVSGHGMTFTVTSIGGVGQISAPAASSSTAIPVPTVPTASSASGGLPAGFPSQVPAPPGKITSAAQIGAGKWTLQVSESSASALTDYEKILEARGFSVTSHTSNAAGDFADLAGGSIQIVLEQMSFPGQGVILSVTVGS